MRSPLGAIILLILWKSVACSQQSDSLSVREPSAIDIIQGDGLTALKALGFELSAPARWDGRDWLTFSAVGVGTAASSGLDIDVRALMRRNQTKRGGDLANAAMQYGSGLNMILLSAGGYAAGLAVHNRWLRETSMLAGSAIIIAGTVSTLTKVVVGRARPYVQKGHLTFRPFTLSTEDYASLPSGHTIVAFAFSGVLAERIQNTWASIALYSLAASCGVSRMYTDEHWVSDVVLGALTSVAISRSLVSWFEAQKESSASGGLRLVPTGNAVTLVWEF
ncbi:MAG TPA: phosphatase PAP2 family protein [Bacteroidota bacterium]|nr:phosphatase PAP2 family protein [Bacteroidota bacterium]